MGEREEVGDPPRTEGEVVAERHWESVTVKVAERQRDGEVVPVAGRGEGDTVMQAVGEAEVVEQVVRVGVKEGERETSPVTLAMGLRERVEVGQIVVEGERDALPDDEPLMDTLWHALTDPELFKDAVTEGEKDDETVEHVEELPVAVKHPVPLIEGGGVPEGVELVQALKERVGLGRPVAEPLRVALPVMHPVPLMEGVRVPEGVELVQELMERVGVGWPVAELHSVVLGLGLDDPEPFRETVPEVEWVPELEASSEELPELVEHTVPLSDTYRLPDTEGETAEVMESVRVESWEGL